MRIFKLLEVRVETWGCHGDYMPLPTRPIQYSNPMLLLILIREDPTPSPTPSKSSPSPSTSPFITKEHAILFFLRHRRHRLRRHRHRRRHCRCCHRRLRHRRCVVIWAPKINYGTNRGPPTKNYNGKTLEAFIKHASICHAYR